MKQKFIRTLLTVSGAVEILLSLVVLAAILISSVSLVCELGIFNGQFIKPEQLDSFLGHALGLVVGVEFIKMLIRHTPGAVIEVLLFAIARQLIVYHTSTLETLIGILAVGCAFAIRKYLFVEKIDVGSASEAKHEKLFSKKTEKNMKKDTENL